MSGTGTCTEKLPGCRGECCNCEQCARVKGRRDICARCAAALQEKAKAAGAAA